MSLPYTNRDWATSAALGSAVLLLGYTLTQHLRLVQRRRESFRFLRTPLDYERHALEFGNALGIAYFGYYSTSLKESFRACREALERVKFIPRSMRGVESSCKTTYFDREVAAPLVVAPTALHRLADVRGEVATATGAGQAGCVYCYNYFMASKPLEEVAKVPGEKWLHLYLFKERHLVEFALEECLEKYKGVFSAVIVTLDHPHNRVRDSVLPYFRKHWQLGEMFQPYMPNLARAAGFATPPRSLEVLFRGVDVGGTNDFSLEWKDLEWLAGKIRGRVPLVGKGVLHPDDALSAVRAGCAAVVVSSHGGRQCDLAAGALDMLPRVVSALQPDHPKVLVFCDTGVRTSADVLRILALGGHGALVGRPPLFALMCGGSDALRDMLVQWAKDITEDMQCLGWKHVAQVPDGILF